jgi:hypothetical protein
MRFYMGKKEIGMIEGMGIQMERFAGKAIRAKVMEGSERITAKSNPAEIAAWVKGAMGRLDKLVAKEKRIQIRENCGYACVETNKSMIAGAKANRKKYKNIDEFLANEQRKPLTGTRLTKEGHVLYWFFTPRSFTPPRRCFCSLLAGLPEDEAISPTYCLCSQGFVRKYWESVLEKPVKVQLLESCASGARECKFAVYL